MPGMKVTELPKATFKLGKVVFSSLWELVWKLVFISIRRIKRVICFGIYL